MPQGRLTEHLLSESKIYRGYEHRWWLYIPAQYDGKKPAALMVFQDGNGFAKREGQWRVPIVLDNLIARHDLPVMVAVFVDPGRPTRPSQLAGDQRSLEYDTLSDRYVSFLLTEVLAEAGKLVRISDDANERGIAGASSGGIAAFTAAWQHDDSFRRVFSAIGSFVNIRGGGAYPEIIRGSARKPLRVFLEDGVNDQLGGPFVGLNWPEGNRQMTAALAAKGYDYQLVMGVGTHNGQHGAAIFPDAMRWLWHSERLQP